ncbi:hypothetical protein [Cupriavidus malaysiensis]|uniref:Uncharacterized protein n=1 Tax=Cupriavidus malaysiensis TaxID=367825 RepID=A0ABM6FGR9_9BURK|nr:hypothetical protein [Cupriavidus malaysiensis]AOZ11150.1 hypothetical protein BKK80_34920 [Cupriavidus malaysiensis]
MSPDLYQTLRADVIARGFQCDIDWSESLHPVTDADVFGREYVFVICNSGMKAQIARAIYSRVMEALVVGASAKSVFGHPGKAGAIDRGWRGRKAWLDAYLAAEDKLTFLGALPWIGEITKFHLAKNLGVDVAKPDRHLQRVADVYGLSVDQLCAELSRSSGDRVATVDYVIWRACNLGILLSQEANRYRKST